MEEALSVFLTVIIIICCCLIFLALFKAIKGPTIADRLVAVNMIGTQTIIIIAILAVKLNEAWLTDIAVIYALISFVAIVVFTKIYIGEFREKNQEDPMDEEEKKSFGLNGDNENESCDEDGALSRSIQTDDNKLSAPEKKEPVPFIVGEINIPRTRDGKPLPELKDEEGQQEE